MPRLLGFGMVESVATTVDDLLDREKRDQDAGQRDCSIKRGDRRIRGQPKTAETAKEIEIAVVDQAGRYHEHYQTNDHFGSKTRPAVHRFRNSGEIEVIVAAGCHRRGDENTVDEQ